MSQVNGLESGGIELFPADLCVNKTVSFHGEVAGRIEMYAEANGMMLTTALRQLVIKGLQEEGMLPRNYIYRGKVRKSQKI